jgi:hypothetical protein
VNRRANVQPKRRRRVPSRRSCAVARAYIAKLEQRKQGDDDDETEDETD